METQVAKNSGRSVWVLGAVAVVMGLVLGAVAVVVLRPEASHAAVTLERADVSGDDPFSDSVTTGAVPVIEQPAVQAASAVRASLPADASTSVLVATGTAPGLYGGTGDAHVCDAAKLVSYLNDHQDKAQAFSEVLGITPEGIGDYVATLTPVVLISDTVVTNHGFKNGHATTLTSVLQAGTAVMVDPQGVPRVKCNCGNPLTPPQVVPSADWRLHGNAWDGYDTASVTGVVAGDAVTEFRVCHLRTGEIYTVPAGSTLTNGTPPPNIDGDYTIALRADYALTDPTSSADLAAGCPTAGLEGAVLVIRGTRATIDRVGQLGNMEGIVEGAPAGSPDFLAQMQRDLNGAVITVHPTNGATPEIVFAVVPSDTMLAGTVRLTDKGRSVAGDDCAAGVVATSGGSSASTTPTTSATTSTTTAAAPTPVAGTDLRSADWGNRTYHVSDDCQGPDITLRNGAWQDAQGLFGVRLAGVIYGDLTGDGQDDAVVMLECFAIGGNAYPATPNFVFTSNASGPVQLGDAFEGNKAAIVGNTVQTTDGVWGANDPRCCPSSYETTTWRYQNGAWVS